MREILFRAFVKDKNKIFNVKEIDFTNLYIHFEEENKPTDTLRMFDQIKLMQFTGLTDKNGKEIFEGDIVKLKDKNNNYEWTAVVEFGNPNSYYSWGWQLKPITKNVEYNLDILCWVDIDDFGIYCEVIGNIFDNPELLGGAE